MPGEGASVAAGALCAGVAASVGDCEPGRIAGFEGGVEMDVVPVPVVDPDTVVLSWQALTLATATARTKAATVALV
ncbi:hypothetical protein GCM10027262_77590 [Nocardia tengchongensis]